MDRLETEDFVVVSENGFQKKKQQLVGIEAAVKANTWRRKGMTKVDEDMNFRHYDNVAVLSLRGWNRLPDQRNEPKEKFAITEVWVRSNQDWRVAQLHFTQLSEGRLPARSPQK
jgi:hypothetical protein